MLFFCAFSSTIWHLFGHFLMLVCCTLFGCTQCIVSLFFGSLSGPSCFRPWPGKTAQNGGWP